MGDFVAIEDIKTEVDEVEMSLPAELKISLKG